MLVGQRKVADGEVDKGHVKLMQWMTRGSTHLLRTCLDLEVPRYLPAGISSQMFSSLFNGLTIVPLPISG